jgi:hypothetical protein
MSGDIYEDGEPPTRDQAKREFMRAYVLQLVRSNHIYSINGKDVSSLGDHAAMMAEDAREAWDAIEREAAK